MKEPKYLDLKDTYDLPTLRPLGQFLEKWLKSRERYVDLIPLEGYVDSQCEGAVAHLSTLKEKDSNLEAHHLFQLIDQRETTPEDAGIFYLLEYTPWKSNHRKRKVECWTGLKTFGPKMYENQREFSQEDLHFLSKLCREGNSLRFERFPIKDFMDREDYLYHLVQDFNYLEDTNSSGVITSRISNQLAVTMAFNRHIMEKRGDLDQKAKDYLTNSIDIARNVMGLKKRKEKEDDRTQKLISRNLSPTEYLALDINEIGLERRTANALIGAGVNNVEELTSKSQMELLKYNQFGKKALFQVMGELEKIGLSLRK